MSLVKFAYNNSYHASIGCAPFEEALYGRKCIPPLCWDTVGDNAVLGLDWVQRSINHMGEIHQQMLVAQSRHKSNVDIRRQDLEF
jgi:hypothetical protein